MKKLLGILLTAVMLCTSMGALATNNATDDNVVVSVDFEDDVVENDDGKKTLCLFAITKNDTSVIETAETHKFSDTVTVNPRSGATGEKFLKLGGTGKTSEDYLRFTYTAGADNNPFEWGTCYKISFWYASTRQWGTPCLYFEGGWNEYRSNNTLLYPQSSATVTWRYYEVYMRTKEKTESDSVTPTIGLRLEHDGQNTQYQYYDDFKITKADGAFIGFATSVTNKTNLEANNYKNMKTVPVTIGEEKVQFCPNSIVYTPATDVSAKTITVISQYLPKTALPATTYLVAGIYKNDTNGKRILQGVELKPCTYNKTSYMTSSSTKSNDGFTGITTTPLDLTAYSNDCYVQVFMIDNLASINSASLTATLPAATPAA